MAYEDFTAYNETDEGTNVTVITNKVSWSDLDRDETSHVSISKGAAHFSGDFEHKFEIQYSDVVSNPQVIWWMLANRQADEKTLRTDDETYVHLHHYRNDYIRIQIIEGGSIRGNDSFVTPVSGTTYYITLSRDDDGGANSTGRYTVEIRTESHTGTLVDTLIADCSVDEQNDFEYIFALASYDDNTTPHTADGFTQNLDLQEPSSPIGTGAMTLNTGWLV